jgi:hypothetical protein
VLAKYQSIGVDAVKPHPPEALRRAAVERDRALGQVIRDGERQGGVTSAARAMQHPREQAVQPSAREQPP